MKIKFLIPSVFLAGLLSSLLFFCKKEAAKTPPTVTIVAVTNITTNAAASGGEVTSDGGSAVTARGVCWSTSQNPTISDNKTTDGSGTGSFSSNITGLNANSTYYVRAYATNNVGTGYGTALSFKTLQVIAGTVTDIDGNDYHTVIIGNQEWMAENLKVTKYRNGDPISNVTEFVAWSTLTTGGYCNLLNDVSKSIAYGRLYNWYAVNDSRNIAPVGWHVPTDAEWTTLTTYLGGESVAGGKMKEAGTAHWCNPNVGATNESGFTALPIGSRSYQYDFLTNCDWGLWWSATVYSESEAYNRIVFDSEIGINRVTNNKKFGFSIRCIKD